MYSHLTPTYLPLNNFPDSPCKSELEEQQNLHSLLLDSTLHLQLSCHFKQSPNRKAEFAAEGISHTKVTWMSLYFK